MTIEEFQRRAAHVSIWQGITRTYSNTFNILIDPINSKLFFLSARLVFEAANNRRFDQQNWKSCAQCVRHSMQWLINIHLKCLCWEYRNSHIEEYEGIPCCCIHLDWTGTISVANYYPLGEPPQLINQGLLTRGWHDRLIIGFMVTPTSVQWDYQVAWLGGTTL